MFEWVDVVFIEKVCTGVEVGLCCDICVGVLFHCTIFLFFGCQFAVAFLSGLCDWVGVKSTLSVCCIVNGFS